jgi:hypothetical protein
VERYFAIGVQVTFGILLYGEFVDRTEFPFQYGSKPFAEFSHLMIVRRLNTAENDHSILINPGTQLVDTKIEQGEGIADLYENTCRVQGHYRCSVHSFSPMGKKCH